MSGPGLAVREDLKLILAVLRESGQPLSVGELSVLLNEKYDRSLDPTAIAYRIRVAPPGTLEAIGTGKGRRYRLADGGGEGARPTEPPPTKQRPTAAAVAAESWLTPEGAELRRLIRRPRPERRYVTYQRRWLEEYVPGSTFYLPEGTRTHLRRIGGTPDDERPAGTFARDILARLLIDLSWASSKLEGNTYSRLDTQNLIEFGQQAEGKDATEAQMILNHKRAIEYLVAPGRETSLDELTLRSLHALLADGLVRDPADEGRLRMLPVSITGTTYIPTEDPNVIKECFERIIQTANEIEDPFERSFFLLVQIPYLQPFIDINKRTSRLAANIPLIEANLCPLTFVDVPEQDYVDGILAIYELRSIALLRDVFVRAYERSCEQYVAVRESAPAPDPIRLRYRSVLGEVVTHMVRERQAPSRDTMLALAKAHRVRPEDQARFVETALAILLNLNDASAMRYGLRPSEFETWRSAYRR